MTFIEDNFIVIQGFAITRLNLSGNELLCYSLIYGFTQDGETTYKGGLSYIASALNISKNSAKGVLDRLQSKGFVQKIDVIINNVKFCEYRAIIPKDDTIQETCTPYKKVVHPIQVSCTPPVQESCTNNIILDKDKSNIYNIPDQTNLVENTTEKKESKTLFRNSEIYALADVENNDYSRLEALFSGDEYANIDIVYYFHSVADWSDSSNTKRTKRGWVATIRNFIRGDIERGRLHTKTRITNEGFDLAAAQRYLNM